MTLNELVKQLVPPILIDGYIKFFNRRLKNEHRLSGDYTFWNDAVAASTGYDSALILEKTKAALLKVKNGEAIYERDSVIFSEVQYNWPLLAGLMWVAAESEGKLNLLDFGGSLGSTYYQNRAFLDNLREIKWNIVEQPEHVIVGNKYFKDEVLKFFPSAEQCLSETKPNVILLSGVLQYLENPYEMLDELLDLPIDYFIVDRTSFWDSYSDRLCVQQVPPSIYLASYPIWIFSKQNFLKYFSDKNFEVITEFQSLDLLEAPVHAVWKGMLIKRKINLRI